ncbi:acyltransferase family protein [Gryllotalpicola ginsengisoli]|uniref:acyltransferase family protein n=1 Tax=Gryllotalpicola ginsengisoli TaxID=444608 RepID=UPI0003B6AF8A|nr:acyltransferase [Gryllotalpicola ginsengisoli]
MRYRPELDGLRTLAVFAVIATHLTLPYAAGGWMGVDVFFVLSGYLITSILLGEHDRFGSISLGRFYSRRLLRLYPALIALIVIGAAFFPYLTGSLQGYADAAAFAGFYVSDFVAGTGHSGALGSLIATWSLAVEEHFYLLWPPALILMLRFRHGVLKWTAAAGGVSLASLVVASFFQTSDGSIDAAYYLPSSRFCTLLLGCAIAVLLQRRVRVKALESAWAGAGIALAAASLVLAANYLGRYPHFAWESPAIGLLSAAMIWHLTTADRSIVRVVLSWAPLVWAGRRSYGIYLYHLPVMAVLQSAVLPHFPVRHLIFSAVVYGVTIAVAALSYRFLESPFLRLKTRFSPSRVRSAAASPEVAAA